MNQNYTITIDLRGMWVIALLTFMVFLILKLANIIAWPWVWVFSPMWIACGIYAVLFLILVTVMLVQRIIDRCRA